MRESWGGFRPSFGIRHAQFLKMFGHERCIDVFRQHIRWIAAAGHLLQDKVAGADLVLYPKIGNREMPDLSQAATTAYSYGRRRVC